MWLISLIVIVTSIWVLVDAHSKGLGYAKSIAWFVFCLLLWIVAFPWYLIKRRHFGALNAKQSLNASSGDEQSNEQHIEPNDQSKAAGFMWAGGILGFLASANSVSLVTVFQFMGHTYWSEFFIPKITYTIAGIIIGYAISLLFNISKNLNSTVK